MNKFDRRGFLAGTAGAAGLVMLGGLGAPARAAGPLNVGVLIPGSKSDKGWMESGYDGMKAAEKKLGDKVSVKEEIARYRELMGVNHFIMRCQWPGLPQEQTLATIRRLGEIFG